MACKIILGERHVDRRSVTHPPTLNIRRLLLMPQSLCSLIVLPCLFCRQKEVLREEEERLNAKRRKLNNLIKMRAWTKKLQHGWPQNCLHCACIADTGAAQSALADLFLLFSQGALGPWGSRSMVWTKR